MENLFLGAFIISVVYIIFIFLEMRYINGNGDGDGENEKPMKEILKNGLLVYLSVVVGIFTIEQFKPEMEKIVSEAPPLVFVDNPPF